MKAESYIILIGGMLFGFGLGLSTMTQPEVVLSFLQFVDLGLLFVMGGAVVVFMLSILLREHKKSLVTHQICRSRNFPFSKNIIYGGIIFGLGWGISGMCPGAAFASIGVGNWPILIGIIGMLIGAYVFRRMHPGAPA